MKTIGFSLMAVVCLSLISSFAAGYSGGTGTVEDPFQIASVEDFLAMTMLPGDWGSSFILTEDIDLSGQTFANSPIAFGTQKRVDGNFKGTRFSGTFDGDDHHISNLTIQNNTGNDNIALFGNTGYATIKDLHLVDVNINISNIYSWYVGALVGEMYEGTVSNCSSSGTITACNGSLSVAGLVGSQDWGTISQCSSSVSITAGNDCGTVGGLVGGCGAGAIQQCFSTGAITGGINNRNMGGLVGYHLSSFEEYAISDCYSTGNISAGANSYNIAGLIGMNSQGPVNRCYSTGLVTAGSGSTAVAGCLGYVGGGSNFKSLFWDTNTSQQTLGVGSGSSTNVYGRSTAEMMTMSTFTNAPGWQSGWDFSNNDGNPPVWKMTSEGSSYPTLDWQPDLDRYSGGDGTAANPWQIATKDDLLLLSNTPGDWDKAFIVTADIDLAGTVFDKAVIAPDTDGSDYEFQGTRFTGSFDGGGYSILNLTISNTTGGDFLGLFGYTDGATIQNLALNGVLIDAHGGESNNWIGGLIGFQHQDQGLTQNCSVSGTIHAGNYVPGDIGTYVGGLIGFCDSEYWGELAVNRCSSSVEVHGSSDVGGLVGHQSGCMLRECFSTGSAEAYSFTGGLVGQGVGVIERCFTTASVRDLYGGLYMGGMAGYYGGNISDSYARSSIFVHSGSSCVGGFTGSASGSVSGIDRCYSASTITLNDNVSNNVGSFVGQPQGSISACFFDSGIINWPDDYSGATAVNTAEMQIAATFIDAGWDFNPEAIDGTPAVWKIDGVDYPTLVWYQSIQATYSGGDGTLGNPYQIATVEELLLLSNSPADWDKHFILTADIDLTGKIFNKAPIAPDTDDATEEFQGTFFSGTFNGNGHAIGNLTISNSVGSDYLGLFGYLDHAEVHDLRLEQVSISATGASSQYLGALAGYMNSAYLRGCSSSGIVMGGEWTPGGFSGNSSHPVGGLVGLANGEYQQFISFEDCFSSADVAGHWAVGGLVGYQTNCGIVRSSASGSVTGTYIGGLVGQSAGVIDQCFSSASVMGTANCDNIGGLIGAYYGGEMTDSFSSGQVFACSGGIYIGGLVGANWTIGSNINRCYSTAHIETCGASTSFVGGLAGLNSGSIANSFWDIDSSGLATSAGGTGLGTNGMMQRSTFVNAGWDFNPKSVDGTPAVWRIKDGVDYPRLAAFKYGTGSGTLDNPYMIDSVEKLLFLSDSPDDWDKHFILMVDLDLSGHTFDRAPIAPDTDDNTDDFQGTFFSGTFNGNGHTISNLTIRTENGGDYLGLFGNLQNAVIRNLRIDNISITAFGKNQNLGAVAGLMGNSQLSLCVVSGSITAGRVSNADSFWNVGGLVGAQSFGLIESCAARVNISSGVDGRFIGGIVGTIADGTIRRAFAAGAIDCGQNTRHVGGLAGYVQPAVIENSCAHGSVSVGPNYYAVGGLVGFLSTGEVRNSYSAARVLYSGTCCQIGGLVGYSGGSDTNSFWDTEASGIGWSRAGIGLTTAKMMQKSTFTAAGWDFDDTSIDGDPADWRIRDREDYPRLVWQPILPGDLAGTPEVNITDLMVVAEQWMQPCSGCPADVNGDGVVNMTDLSILGGYWLMIPGWGAVIQP